MGTYFFKNYEKAHYQSRIPDLKGSRGLFWTNINNKVRGGLRYNECHALKLHRLLIKHKQFPIRWVEDIEGNILITFGKEVNHE